VKIRDLLFGPSGDDDEEPETTDPRDMVGDNPTGRARRSSGRKRRKENRKQYRGTKWEK
jgi:hypothetical protein